MPLFLFLHVCRCFCIPCVISSRMLESCNQADQRTTRTNSRRLKGTNQVLIVNINNCSLSISIQLVFAFSSKVITYSCDGLIPIDIQAILSALPSALNIQCLNFSNNDIGDKGALGMWSVESYIQDFITCCSDVHARGCIVFEEMFIDGTVLGGLQYRRCWWYYYYYYYYWLLLISSASAIFHASLQCASLVKLDVSSNRLTTDAAMTVC